MTKYNHIIFDLDGTLTNPYNGVFNSLQFALQQMSYPTIPDELPAAFIGPPLQKSFSEIYGMNKKQTDIAVEYFRQYYGRAGLYENELYEGISELLENLTESGMHVYVATSKLEKYARLVLEHFELDKYLKDMSGADYGGQSTKTELIQRIIDKYQLDQNEVVMIGDTAFDLIGANNCNIDSIAVGYGYGTDGVLQQHRPTYFVRSVEDLADLFFGL